MLGQTQIPLEDCLWLRGQQHIFPDGISITIVEVKLRPAAVWITYEVVAPGGLPKRSGLYATEFFSQFGHLFQKP